MKYNLVGVFLFSEDPLALAMFYEKVFGLTPGWSEGDYRGYQLGNTQLMIGRHSKVVGKNKEPDRIMINIEVKDVEMEFEKAMKLGATVVAKPYHPDEAAETTIATLADPDGNYFQLVTPMKM